MKGGNPVENDASWLQTIGVALVWALLVLAAIAIFRKQLGALLARPDLAIEIAGFKISANDQKQAAESMKAALVARGRDASEEQALTEMSLLATAAESLGRPAKVLWVDDQPSNNQLECEALDRVRAAVELATSTEHALVMIDIRGPYDVIISDMARPGRPRAGFDLLEQLRDNGDQTPFIIYSFYDPKVWPERFDMAVERGAIGSSYEPVQLFELIARALRTVAAIKPASRRRSRRVWRTWRRRPAKSIEG